MPTLEQLLRHAAKAARKPATRARRAAPLWSMPDDLALLPDLIQTMDFGEARTIEQQIAAVYQHRSTAIWDFLALEPGQGGPQPWACCLPLIWDPAGLLDGEHRDGWASVHWGLDYYPSPLGGLQHRVSIVGGQFVSHGVPASLLPSAPC